MSKIISTSVTPEQYEIINKLASEQNMSISKFMKESVQVYTALSYVTNVLAKLKWNEVTQEAIDRNCKIMELAEEMVKIMEPLFKKALAAIPKEVIKTLEDEGKELNHSMKIYSKPVKRGRPPAITTRRKLT